MLRTQSSRAIVVLAGIFVAFNAVIVFLAGHGDDKVPGSLLQQIIGFWVGVAILLVVAWGAVKWVDAGEG